MYQQKDYNLGKPFVAKQRIMKAVGLVFLVIIAGLLAYSFANISREITINGAHVPWWQRAANALFATSPTDDAEALRRYNEAYVMPDKEPDRWDVLLMGIRGKDDSGSDENGNYLTDTIMVFSIDRNTGHAALVAIPRDLYVNLDPKRMEKINAAYEVGFSRSEGGAFVKELVSTVTGVYIDNVVVFDFSSFKTIIDALGGIDITLTKEFHESTQFGNEFYLPAGENHLDGEQALYYARSRFSTSDFDRSFRQQQILLAIKKKLLALDFLGEPTKALTVLVAIKSNIYTDLNIFDIGSLAKLGKQLDNASASMRRYVISTDNVVYETHAASGTYILLPRGDSFDLIKQLFGAVLDPKFNASAFNTPTPAANPVQIQ